jgi:hypothetical protein
MMLAGRICRELGWDADRSAEECAAVRGHFRFNGADAAIDQSDLPAGPEQTAFFNTADRFRRV